MRLLQDLHLQRLKFSRTFYKLACLHHISLTAAVSFQFNLVAYGLPVTFDFFQNFGVSLWQLLVIEIEVSKELVLFFRRCMLILLLYFYS